MFSQRLRPPLMFPLSVLLSLSLAACMGGGGHHGGGGGGGGGGGNPNVALGFASGSTQSLALVAGSDGMLTFIVTNGGNLASSGSITVTFPLTNNGTATNVTFVAAGSGGTGWDCSGSTGTNVSCMTSASIQPGASAPTLMVVLHAAANAVAFPTQPTIVNAGNSNNGQQTYTLNVTVSAMPNPVPSTTSLSPMSTTAGALSPLALTVIGSNFVSSSVVQWNGTALTTNFVDSGHLSTSIPTSDLAASGTGNVTVMTPAPGGGTSSPALVFTINSPQPVITGLNPPSAIQGGGNFTLMVTGTGFTANSVVNWNGTALTTVYISGTTLSSQVPASDIASGTSANVTVFNPAPPTGGVTSAAAMFMINSTNPTPVIGSISPNNAPAGYGAFTLTVSGTGFVPGSIVQWNGTPLATTFFSSVLITASVPASDVMTMGSASVTVVSPPPPTGGQTSNAKTFTINAMSSTSVKITQPLMPLVVLHVGQALNLFVAVVSGGSCTSAGNDVQWLVDGSPGTSSNPGGMMTPATLSGAAATYTAPQSPPFNGGFAYITAVCASNTSITSASITVLIVTGNNTAFSGQFAYVMNGFGPTGLPLAIIGSLTSNGTGGLANVFQDSTVSTNGTSGGIMARQHISMTAWYAMDSPTHGYVQMFETSNPSAFEDFTIELNSGGFFGSLIEIDGPNGNTGSGVFTQVNPNTFTFAKFNGTYLTAIAGTNAAGNKSQGVIGMFTVTETDATHAMVSAGDAYDTAGNHDTLTGSATIDDATAGHGMASLTFVGGTTINAVSFYIVGRGHAFVLVQGSTTGVVESGAFAFQPPGQNFGGQSGTQIVFSALGINSANHASVIAGVLTVNQQGALSATYDMNDGGTLQSTAPNPGTFTAKGTVNATTGQGSASMFSAGAPLQGLVFYQRIPGGGFFMEQPATPGGATEGRIGFLIPQAAPTGGSFVDSQLDGLMLAGDTAVETVGSANGLAIATFHGTTSPGTFSGVGDASAVGFAPAINGIIGGNYHFTDTTKGRGTLTTTTNTFFGSSNSAFYAFDSFGDLVVVPLDTTTKDPQEILLSP